MRLIKANPSTLMHQMGLAQTVFQPIWEELTEYLNSRQLEMEALAQQMAIYWNSGSNPGPLGNPALGQSISPNSKAVKAALAQPDLSPAREWMLQELLNMALAVEEAWTMDQTAQAMEPDYQTQSKPYRASEAPMDMVEPLLDEMARQMTVMFQSQVAGIFSALVESHPMLLMKLMENEQSPDLLSPMDLLETLIILEQQLAEQWANLYQMALDQHPDRQSSSLQLRIQSAAEAKMLASEQLGSRIQKALNSESPLETLLALNDFTRRLMKTREAPLSA